MGEPITPVEPGNDSSVADKHLIQTLVDAGATYVAAAEGPLPEGLSLLVDGSPEGRKQCWEVLEGVEAVQVADDTSLPLAYDDALARTTHNRVPLYIAEGHEELTAVDVIEGVANLRAAVNGDWEFTPARDQTGRLADIVEAFVDAGAVSVTASREMLGRNEVVDLCVGLPAEAVYDIAGQYETVTVDGEPYPVHVEPLVFGGPQGEMLRVGLYYGENINGIEPKSVEEGLDDLRACLESDRIYPRPTEDD